MINNGREKDRGISDSIRGRDKDRGISERYSIRGSTMLSTERILERMKIERCCPCNGKGKCKRCICIDAGRKCSNCQCSNCCNRAVPSPLATPESETGGRPPQSATTTRGKKIEKKNIYRKKIHKILINTEEVNADGQNNVSDEASIVNTTENQEKESVKNFEVFCSKFEVFILSKFEVVFILNSFQST
eukprot:GHVR01121200.1.p1 GENE.GHVR01121200.1~~GHVR01121200.1.p1  ORF type:complete len:189 (+),score=30.38 GHVR01121200.1:150-716(+)